MQHLKSSNRFSWKCLPLKYTLKYFVFLFLILKLEKKTWLRPFDTSPNCNEFADDTTIIGCISDGDKSGYRAEMRALTSWCWDNNLLLNISKAKELIADYSKLQGGEHTLIHIDRTGLERIRCFKFLVSTSVRTWAGHITWIWSQKQRNSSASCDGWIGLAWTLEYSPTSIDAPSRDFCLVISRPGTALVMLWTTKLYGGWSDQHTDQQFSFSTCNIEKPLRPRILRVSAY